jgi:hypothetical protein
MVMRFLFCLTSSLLSGSVVAVLFTAMVQYAFPDDADGHRGPTLANFAAEEERRAAKPPLRPEPVADQAHQEVPPVLISGRADGLPAAKSASNTSAEQNPSPSLRSGPQPEEQQRHPELTILTQEAAQNRGHLLAAPGAPGLLPENAPPAELPGAIFDPPAQPGKLAHVAQPSTELPTQDRNPAPGPAAPQNVQDQKAASAVSRNAKDAHVRATAGGHATRNRQTTRASHADRAQRRREGHTVNHRKSGQSTQRQAQN